LQSRLVNLLDYRGKIILHAPVAGRAVRGIDSIKFPQTFIISGGKFLFDRLFWVVNLPTVMG
jgi:hypothetical protein